MMIMITMYYFFYTDAVYIRVGIATSKMKKDRKEMALDLSIKTYI